METPVPLTVDQLHAWAHGATCRRTACRLAGRIAVWEQRSCKEGVARSVTTLLAEVRVRHPAQLASDHDLLEYQLWLSDQRGELVRDGGEVRKGAFIVFFIASFALGAFYALAPIWGVLLLLLLIKQEHAHGAIRRQFASVCTLFWIEPMLLVYLYRVRKHVQDMRGTVREIVEDSGVFKIVRSTSL